MLFFSVCLFNYKIRRFSRRFFKRLAYTYGSAGTPELTAHQEVGMIYQYYSSTRVMCYITNSNKLEVISQVKTWRLSYSTARSNSTTTRCWKKRAVLDYSTLRMKQNGRRCQWTALAHFCTQHCNWLLLLLAADCVYSYSRIVSELFSIIKIMYIPLSRHECVYIRRLSILLGIWGFSKGYITFWITFFKIIFFVTLSILYWF